MDYALEGYVEEGSLENWETVALHWEEVALHWGSISDQWARVAEQLATAGEQALSEQWSLAARQWDMATAEWSVASLDWSRAARARGTTRLVRRRSLRCGMVLSREGRELWGDLATSRSQAERSRIVA